MPRGRTYGVGRMPLRNLLRLSSFTILSGIGWCIDFAIFNLLVALGHSGFAANLVSATVAVTFVLVMARRWIFHDHVETLGRTVARYAAWNVVAITVASLAIRLIMAALERFDWTGVAAWAGTAAGHPVATAALVANLAKIMVTPFTMYANFVATGYIIERRLRFY